MDDTALGNAAVGCNTPDNAADEAFPFRLVVACHMKSAASAARKFADQTDG
jgi:hypothetical protein